MPLIFVSKKFSLLYHEDLHLHGFTNSVKSSHIKLSWKPSSHLSNSYFLWAYTTFPWITQKSNHIDISLTETDKCHPKLSKRKIFTYYFQYFRKIYKRTTAPSYFGRNLRLLYIWKTSKVKSNYLFFILKKKNLGLTFRAKYVLALLQRITDTFKCLALPKKY